MRFAVALAIVALGAAAGAASADPLRVIGQARASGDLAVAAAYGDKKDAHGLYLRGYGRKLSGFGLVGCSRGAAIGSKATRLGKMVAGRLYRLRQPFVGDCTVDASLTGSGRIRLQILAR
jgi:hypothetical protein